MDGIIRRTLEELEAQEAFEQENPDAVPGREKMLAITRDIGMFYNILLRSGGARRVLEVGTSVGYSTMWFAEAVMRNAGAGITTIEREEEKIRRAGENFARTGLDGIIEIRRGDALDVLEGMEPDGAFDFAFIDADKERCVRYFDLVLPMVRPGGLIGVDNMLRPERFRSYMEPLERHVRGTPGVRAVLIPIDNGELLCTRLDAPAAATTQTS